MLVGRLSRLWTPSAAGMAVSGAEDGHAKLVRAGFLRQSAAGVFHMLPLGHRVQGKIEAIIARHMEASLGKHAYGDCRLVALSPCRRVSLSSRHACAIVRVWLMHTSCLARLAVVAVLSRPVETERQADQGRLRGPYLSSVPHQSVATPGQCG